jgi:hypothetical protein
MQVYLPDDLHQAVKELGLPISELSRHAVRLELRRRELAVEAGPVPGRTRGAAWWATDG